MVSYMTKKELQRRKRISIALKKYHQEKKIIAELDRQLSIELEQRKPIKWKIKKTQLRVKRKRIPKAKRKFRGYVLTDRKKYSLVKAIQVNNEQDVKKIKKATKKIKPRIVRDLIKMNPENKKFNLGYRIKMTFKSSNKKRADTVIDNVSFRKGYTGENHSNGFNILERNMYNAFREYISTTGFAGLSFKGYEIEIEDDE